MLRSIQETRHDQPSQTLAYRGYCPIYRENEVNNCPGCGRTHWIIGRVSAECCFCATALPLSDASVRRNERHTRDNRPIFFQSGQGWG
jgi:hypothetical protein